MAVAMVIIVADRRIGDDSRGVGDNNSSSGGVANGAGAGAGDDARDEGGVESDKTRSDGANS